jgi:cytochrome P450
MIACEASLHAVLAERRRRPGDDLLSRLMESEFEGEPVSDDEVVSYVSLMLGAAAETTANLIGNSLLALLQHPDQLQLLREDPALVPGAIEELLRFDSPAQLHGRWALEDVEVGGRTIPRGSKVILLIGAANRDPDQFPDPDALDVRRSNVRFASFGTGVHYCLGAGFARLEASVALPMVLERYPRLGPIVEGPRWREEHVALRSLATLVVETNRFREDDCR